MKSARETERGISIGPSRAPMARHFRWQNVLRRRFKNQYDPGPGGGGGVWGRPRGLVGVAGGRFEVIFFSFPDSSSSSWDPISSYDYQRFLLDPILVSQVSHHHPADSESSHEISYLPVFSSFFPDSSKFSSLSLFLLWSSKLENKTVSEYR